MAQNRIFYAVQAVGVAPLGSTSFTPMHGVQSLGITTTFNLEQVFELGQISIYENIENIPDVEVTLEKVLDGYPLMTCLLTQGAPAATLAGRQNVKTIVGVGIWSDEQSAASGSNLLTQCNMSGMAVSNISFKFPVNANFTESITVVGNDKVWKLSGFTFTNPFSTNADGPIGVGGVNRREDMLFDYTSATRDANGQVIDVSGTILPRDCAGISSSGTNDRRASDGRFNCKLQNITISTNLGRDELFELGNKSPYTRFVTFPVEVTTEIEFTALSGDLISATEAGVQSNGNNTLDQTIKIATREGTRLDLGLKNRLQSVNYGGGDAGGGNVTITNTYRNFNDLQIQHSGDLTVALRPF